MGKNEPMPGFKAAERWKVSGKYKRLFAKLTKRYESKEEKLKRIKALLVELVGPDDSKELEEKIADMEDPAIPFKGLKELMGTEDEAEILEFIIAPVKKVGSVDIMRTNSNVVLRILPGGTRSRRVFLVIKGVKKRHVVRYLGMRRSPHEPGYSLLNDAWIHLDAARGGQKEYIRFPESVIEEYCGIGLSWLKKMCKNKREENLFDACFDKFGITKTLSNLAYKADSAEIVRIDKS